MEGHVSGVKSSKLGSQMWGTLFLQEKLTVVTSHLLLYCGSKGGFYIEILSLLLLMIYLFFCLLMILVWACPIHLVYRFTQLVSTFLFEEVVLCKTVDSLCPWEERRSGASMS